jgi:hypothetical protein
MRRRALTTTATSAILFGAIMLTNGAEAVTLAVPNGLRAAAATADLSLPVQYYGDPCWGGGGYGYGDSGYGYGGYAGYGYGGYGGYSYGGYSEYGGYGGSYGGYGGYYRPRYYGYGGYPVGWGYRRWW